MPLEIAVPDPSQEKPLVNYRDPIQPGSPIRSSDSARLPPQQNNNNNNNNDYYYNDYERRDLPTKPSLVPTYCDPRTNGVVDGVDDDDEDDNGVSDDFVRLPLEIVVPDSSQEKPIVNYRDPMISVPLNRCSEDSKISSLCHTENQEIKFGPSDNNTNDDDVDDNGHENDKNDDDDDEYCNAILVDDDEDFNLIFESENEESHHFDAPRIENFSQDSSSNASTSEHASTPEFWEKKKQKQKEAPRSLRSFSSQSTNSSGDVIRFEMEGFTRFEI